MNWNYRVLAKKCKDGSFSYSIKEVQYENEKPISYSGHPYEQGSPVSAESFSDLSWMLSEMREALKKPILWEGKEFPEKFSVENKYTFFWNGPFSNWARSEFTIGGKKFNCVEQYMMFEKAWLFEDLGMAEKIYKTDNPKKQKEYGRNVKRFSEKVWDNHKEKIVYRGLKAKFTQNPFFLKKLAETEHTELVEASPYDCIWGVGLSKDDPKIQDSKNWKGLNLLGKLLTKLRIELHGK